MKNYGELQAAVRKWLHRTDLEAETPQFIALFEAFANRVLRLQAMQKMDYVYVVDGRGALPADYLELISPRSEGVPLLFFNERVPVGRGGYGFDGHNLVLPAAYSGPIAIAYYAKFPEMQAANDRNWLLLHAPDAYLYGALVEAEPYIWNDARMPMWKARRDEALASLRESDERAKYSGGTLAISSPYGVTTGPARIIDDGGVSASIVASNDLYHFVNTVLPERF